MLYYGQTGLLAFPNVPREYSRVDDVIVNYVGKCRPTVERWLASVAKSSIAVSPNAAPLLKEICMAVNATKIYVSGSGGRMERESTGGVVFDLFDDMAKNVFKAKQLSPRARKRFACSMLPDLKTEGDVDDSDMEAAINAAFDKLENAVTSRGIAKKTTPTAFVVTVKKEGAADQIPDDVEIVDKNSSPRVVSVARDQTQTSQPNSKENEMATNKVAKKVAKKATTNGKAPSAPGARTKLYTHLANGGRGTFEQLIKACGGSEGSVRTALTDFKNPKYAPGGQVLAIVKDEDGVYGVGKGAHVKSAASRLGNVGAASKSKKRASRTKAASPASSNKSTKAKKRANGIAR
jgi:hypothetical protein